MWINIWEPTGILGYHATAHREGCMYTADRETSSSIWEQVDDLEELSRRTPHNVLVKPCSSCHPGTPTWNTTRSRLEGGQSPEGLAHLIIVYSQVFQE